jgi:hypothetical protein
MAGYIFEKVAVKAQVVEEQGTSMKSYLTVGGCYKAKVACNLCLNRDSEVAEDDLASLLKKYEKRATVDLAMLANDSSYQNKEYYLK